MDDLRIAVIVVPRERLSWRGIDAFFAGTTTPHQLIFVDGGSRGPIRRELTEASRERGFELVRVDRYLTPNEARNLGLERVADSVEYVAFLDNDVFVEPGWLDALVRCADETGADAVGPLTYEGEPRGAIIHTAHGDIRIEDSEQGRRLVERNWLIKRKPEDVAGELHRRECTLVEFHAVLMRADRLREVGGFDEQLLSTREHVDFLLELNRRGGSVWCEPEARTHFIPGPPFRRGDLAYYMTRWSDDWERRSLEHFRSKWDLPADENYAWRLKHLGRRRHTELLEPLARRVTPGGRGAWRLERLLRRPERVLNRRVSRRTDRRRAAVGG